MPQNVVYTELMKKMKALILFNHRVWTIYVNTNMFVISVINNNESGGNESEKISGYW